MSEQNSFDKLAAGLDRDERLALLSKMKTSVDADSQSLEDKTFSNTDSDHDATESLKTESFFIRILMYLKSLFTTTPVEVVYNEHRLLSIAKNIEQNSSGIISYKHGLFLNNFYEEVYTLRAVAEFFRSSISIYEDDQGCFFAYLGTLIIPELTNEISEKANPYSIPLDTEVTPDLRTSFIRKLDEIIQSIPPDRKRRFYEAVQGLEWIRQFTRLPFDKLLTRFTNSDNLGGRTCPLDVVTQEIGTFAKVLCNGRKILPEVLESLYMVLANRNILQTTETADEYLAKSQKNIAALKLFITTIPLRKIGCLSFHSFFWQPDNLVGVEDWFVKYKNHMKKIFDQQWDYWLRDKKKEETRKYMEKRFKLKTFPLLPQRPWTFLWDGINFPHEYTLGFIHSFYENLYPKYSTLFKTIIGEGDFIQKNNRVEFTDAYNEFEHQQIAFRTFDNDLSSTGNTGTLFSQLANITVRTIQTQNKAESLIRKLEADASIMIAKFCGASRSIQLILNGITSDQRNHQYETLSNISSIQGHNNAQFKTDLTQTALDFHDILELIKNLETIELSELNR